MSIWTYPLASEYPTSFTPLFRLLDDFDDYSRETGRNGRHHRSGHRAKTFSPRFDVRELPDVYELHGELPGIEQKDVEIEFTDAQTLTIRGRTERSYSSGTPPSSLVEGQKTGGAITEGGEQNQSHKATVEDEPEADKSEANKSGTQAVAQDQEKQQKQQQHEQAKFWVSERSVGEFARSFNFPTRVDQDNVKASMKDGILTIRVPKAKKHESRKIAISSD